jgi:hypothetical protein
MTKLIQLVFIRCKLDSIIFISINPIFQASSKVIKLQCLLTIQKENNNNDYLQVHTMKSIKFKWKQEELQQQQKNCAQIKLDCRCRKYEIHKGS